jgi:membrane-bound lytic murein transglycosylase D
MTTFKIAGSVMAACLSFMGCASNAPISRQPEIITSSDESLKKYEEVTGELKALRASVASLRQELSQLGAIERSLSSLRGDIQKVRNLERSLSNLRLEVEKLREMEKSISSLQWEMEKVRPVGSYLSILRSEVAKLGEDIRSLEIRPPLTTYKLPREVSLCGEKIPLESRDVWENLDREFLSTLGSEVQVLLWMKRVRRYFPHIEKRLKEMGLPDDLKYVTIVESALRPYAVSSSGAAGIWQFIPSTGERYEMRKNRGIDERLDFFKATEGALAYLKSLHDEFGNWALSLAAYNAGENRVRKEMRLQEINDYYQLDLPMETERYVYKIAVAKIILSDPSRYGFSLDEKECYDPLLVERIRVDLLQPLPFVEVARAVGSFYKQIREMNPQFPDEAIPAGSHMLNLPPGTTERLKAYLSAWQGNGGRK